MNSFCILRALPCVVPVEEKAREVDIVRKTAVDLESIMMSEMGVRMLDVKLSLMPGAFVLSVRLKL